MTHDELLAKLTPTQERGFPSNPITVLNTLRAVVELHKPIEPVVPVESHDDYWYGLCDDCLKTYPCPTIQAIEKELK
jgi:hypothetical protein